MIRSAAVSAVAAAALLFPTSAVAGDGAGPPWTPYSASDWSVPAGERCDFALSSEVLRDKERVRTTEWFPDGSPRVQEFTGQLVVRLTNEESGESVVRNLTGRADVEYFADGAWSMVLVGGHFAAGIPEGGAPGKGFYVVTGRGAELHIDADGRRTLTADQASMENICETLA